ncbi:S8 family serine peptidase [Algihabitans albus]|uniref:S8 family serine peptidase n=1 Tax=Algihabitans albus TaxID=2164067 RepID=UPI000E5C6DB1|nr:S8 family serine peptidase [Algihabitans albus]
MTGLRYRRTQARALPLVAAALWSAALWSAPLQATEPATPRGWLLLAVDRLCGVGPLSGVEAEMQLPGAWLLEENARGPDGQIVALEQVFALPGQGELRLLRLQPGGQLRRFTAEYHSLEESQPRARLQAVAGGDCKVFAGRRLIHREGRPAALDQLDGDLESVRWREILEAPWPEGRDPGGPRVALVDSGLAYDLPLYRDRLARDPEGQPLGYDFWDLDPLPYDGDFGRSAFQPIRHGSAVASVLVREAPTAALIPYRYPRPDMTRLGPLIERAAAAGARILAMPLGSRDPDDWRTFAEALEAHPQLLAIVSAGNDGRDLDREPLWPAALDLPNLVVVTSADGFGRLAPGSNWGAASVDLMVPAENLPVVDFRGGAGRASGSSYAVPRVAALAARLLAADPDLDTAALKAALFARAVASPYEKTAVAAGWIPDPAVD